MQIRLRIGKCCANLFLNGSKRLSNIEVWRLKQLIVIFCTHSYYKFSYFYFYGRSLTVLTVLTLLPLWENRINFQLPKIYATLCFTYALLKDLQKYSPSTYQNCEENVLFGRQDHCKWQYHAATGWRPISVSIHAIRKCPDRYNFVRSLALAAGDHKKSIKQAKSLQHHVLVIWLMHLNFWIRREHLVQYSTIPYRMYF